MSIAGAGPHWSAPTANIERRIRRTMSESRAGGNLPSAWAALSRSVKASAPQKKTSTCTPDSWSKPLAANSQLGVAPQSDITQPG